VKHSWQAFALWRSRAQPRARAEMVRTPLPGKPELSGPAPERPRLSVSPVPRNVVPLIQDCAGTRPGRVDCLVACGSIGRGVDDCSRAAFQGESARSRSIWDSPRTPSRNIRPLSVLNVVTSADGLDCPETSAAPANHREPRIRRPHPHVHARAISALPPADADGA
jgi:hypothetical protein